MIAAFTPIIFIQRLPKVSIIFPMKKNDTSEQARKVLVGIYREMPLCEKVERIFDAYRTGKILAMTGLKELYPCVNQEQIWYLWAKHHLGDKLFKRAYGTSPDEHS